MPRAHDQSMLGFEYQGFEVNNLDFNSVNTECGVSPFFSGNCSRDTVLGFVPYHIIANDSVQY